MESELKKTKDDQSAPSEIAKEDPISRWLSHARQAIFILFLVVAAYLLLKNIVLVDSMIDKF